MNLKSFGCSFIFGSELADDGRHGPYATPSQLTWPAHVAQHLNFNYCCFARPGAGNLQILEQILNQIPHSDSRDFFVIGWTWIDRFDYYDCNFDPRKKRSPWNTFMPIDESELAKTYYKHIHSEYRDKFSTLCHIKLAIDTLEQAGIPFLMTYMDQLIFDQRWHVTPAVEHLQHCVKKHMTQFEDMSFLEWSRHHKYPETAAWHPLEQAHQQAAKYIINRVQFPKLLRS